ncbi:hypothetical protein [Ovoidimarina sediminis]|uniref:hypothetical protein n=1 Tax=Ovoidimarina sediminis TaxID=3079856 RepID=UPI00290BBEA0|nr:hypothetical protein [Rhodophyticola sp. MJ-SS7]MDU8942771.1 hypothetical protein [Rhodophyticola sp. MJ-SS7]
MFHSDRIIHTAHLNDIDRAFTPQKRPLAPQGGSMRTVLAAIATLAAASVIVLGTGLVG